MTRSMPFLLPSLLVVAAQAADPPALAVQSVVPEGAAVAVLPWTNTPAALGDVRTPAGQRLATVAGSWSATHLHLQIVVEDADHVPAANRNVLWSADSVEIGLDLLGDGSATMPATTTGLIGDDDLKLIIGQLTDGPALAVLMSRTPRDDKALLAGVRIARDPADATRLVYRLDLPWAAVGVPGGVRPALGLDVQINDRDAGATDKTAYPWGTGLRGGFTAAQLNRFAFGAPDAGYAAAQWSDLLAWSATDRSVLSIATRSDAELTMRVSLGGSETAVVLPGGAGLRHHRIAVPAQADGTALVASLPGREAVAASQLAAGDVYQKLVDRLSGLAAEPGAHPFFVRHLVSMQALVVAEWARVQLLRGSDPRKAVASVGYMRDLLAGFNGEAGEWAAYLDGRRSLLMSYVSPHDQTVQYYDFGVPKDWDPTKAYPLFFELHGAGDDHPLNGPASRLGLTAQAVKRNGYDTPRVYAEIDRSGYWVHPFCRGNLGYAGIARIDVLETYEHVHNLVSIDADRRYLYGFSMGSMGTLTLSQLTPSRWAAFGAMSGAGSQGAPVRTYLLDNLTGLPFKMMIGGEDGGAKNFVAMAEAMRARGLNPELTVIDKLGHNYTAEMQQEMITWLKTKTRQRPARFAFTTVDNLTSECWGVRLGIDYGVPLRGGGGPRRDLRVVDETAQPFARATVAIAGQTVTIDSVGARRLALDFSKPDGLGLEGEVRVVWNGKEAYAGTAKPLNLE